MRKKVYFLGIGGIAMANLACLLKNLPAGRQGGKYLVSGSDLDTFGPSAVLLKESGISYSGKHNKNHLRKFKPDMVVIGNAMQRGNPGLEYVLNNQIPYCSMPELIKEELLVGKKPIVITGTSGKTTTAALTAWILKESGLKPTALIGGLVTNFGSGFLNGNGDYVVLEGDEYNSSFYDSGAKFLHYRPFIGAVNNIQPDHLDIYGNIDNIVGAFKKFIRLIPSEGLAVLNNANEHTPHLLKELRSEARTFGKNGDIHAENIKINTAGLAFDVYNGSKKIGNIKSSLLGSHNVENILTAVTIGLELKIPFKKISGAMESFKGVRRRLEVIHKKDGISIIDDFAHNPEKVLASLSALRSHFPEHKIIAIFEPRTGSSRRKFFQDAYPASFESADTVYIAQPYKKEALDPKEIFSNKKLVYDINKNGLKAYAINTADEILAHLKNNFIKTNGSPAIFCVMTSGDFDGIHQKLIKLFS